MRLEWRPSGASMAGMAYGSEVKVAMISYEQGNDGY